MKPVATKMMYDQYCLLPEDRNQYELFDGELVMTPSPTHRHQAIVVRLTAVLESFVKKNALGMVFVAPLDVIFDPYTVLQPDILFISRDRLSILGDEAVEGAPDLVVEVLSPSTFYKDLRRKMGIYARFGVQEYWIVDPEQQTIELYGRVADKLQLTRQFSSDDTLESPVLSGFRLAVQSIF